MPNRYCSQRLDSRQYLIRSRRMKTEQLRINKTSYHLILEAHATKPRVAFSPNWSSLFAPRAQTQKTARRARCVNVDFAPIAASVYVGLSQQSLIVTCMCCVICNLRDVTVGCGNLKELVRLLGTL